MENNEKYEKCQYFKNGYCSNIKNEFNNLCSIECCELEQYERYKIWTIEKVLELENQELFRYFNNRIEYCEQHDYQKLDNDVIFEMLKELYEFALTHMENHQSHQIKEYYQSEKMNKRFKQIFNDKLGKNKCNTSKKTDLGGMFS